MSQYKVIVADKARMMSGSHIRFLAQENPSAARKTKANLLEAIRSLEKMPERFPFLDENCTTRGKYRKMFVETWYLILYQVKGTTVYVDYIVDCRQDYGWLVR